MCNAEYHGLCSVIHGLREALFEGTLQFGRNVQAEDERVNRYSGLYGAAFISLADFKNPSHGTWYTPRTDVCCLNAGDICYGLVRECPTTGWYFDI